MKPSLPHILKRIAPWVVAGFFLLGALVAHHQLSSYHIGHIRDLLLSAPREALAEALLVTACGYAIVTLYDRLSLAIVHKNISAAKICFTAFLGFAVSHNTGHAWLSGVSLRYRFYYARGVDAMDVIKIMLLNSIAYGLGLCSLFLGAYALLPAADAQGLAFPGINLIAAALAAVYAGYWLTVLYWRPVVTLKQVPLRLPGPGFTLLQALVGSADVAAAGLVLYILLFSLHTLPFTAFLIAYILALMLGSVSQIPGGLGVFEAVFLQLLSPWYHASDILASLVLYRIIYYFLPLLCAGLMYLAYEIRQAHRLHGLIRKPT